MRSEAREVLRIVREGWRLCTKSCHPHVWNVATVATALFRKPKHVRTVESCPWHGGSDRCYKSTNAVYVVQWRHLLTEQGKERPSVIKEGPNMNNRNRILSFFKERDDKPATFAEILKGVDLVNANNRLPSRVLVDVLQTMKNNGYLAWTRSRPGQKSTYVATPKGRAAFQGVNLPPKQAVKKPDYAMSVEQYFVSDEKMKDSHEQKTLEAALADWTARRAEGKKARLFRVVELHPTLTAKL